MTRDDLDPAARRLWLLVREQVGSTPAAAQDQRRLQAALAERRTKSQEFFSSSAGQWDRCATSCSAIAFTSPRWRRFADAEWTVGDLGCGTGQVSAALAPFVARVIAVDASAAMLQAAQEAAAGSRQRRPCGAASSRRCRSTMARLDAATLMLVLHHVPEPERALAEVARVLKPGGRLLVVDMLPHDRESYRQQMGHVWLGFSDDHIAAHARRDAGSSDVRIVAAAAGCRKRRDRDCSSQQRRRRRRGQR